MSNNPFLQSPAWKRLRAEHLRRSPWCVVCAQVGFRTRATEVDHIRAERLGGSRLMSGNLQSMCKTHHSQKTARGPEAGSARSPHPFTVTGPDGYPLPAGVTPPREETEE